MAPWIELVRDRCTEEFGDQQWVCVMATVDTDGRPTARCMVCRQIDKQGRLLFVSDRRTRKDDHLRARPDCEICFWLPKSAAQIRLRGTACIVDAEIDNFMRENWWDEMTAQNRAIFNAPETDNHMPVTFELIVLTPNEVEMHDLRTRPVNKQTWRHDRAGEKNSACNAVVTAG